MARPAQRILRVVLLLVIPLAAMLAGAYVYGLGGRFVSTDNAYVRADVIAVSSEIDGRIVQVFVDDNAFVQAGQVLFEIDPTAFLLKLAAAEGDLSIIRQQIESLRAQYRESEASVATAKERVRYLQQEHDRLRDLADKGHSTQIGLDEAEHDLITSRQQVHALEQRKLMVVADLGGRADMPVEEHPTYKRALVALDQAALDLGRTKVEAPTAGYIGQMTLEPGEQIEIGDTLFPLISSAPPWVEANMKEVHMTHIMVGQRALVEIDSYPDQVWEASVASISPATGAEFALLPAQNATGNWVKVVQRVPIKLQLDVKPGMPTLRAGMTATIEIDTGQERRLDVFIARVRAGTWDER
jgi:membrane fusion protein, multidrug efflux system